MSEGVTQGGWGARRALSLAAGAGMLASAALTGQVYFAAQYPVTRAAAQWCESSPLFSCDGAVLSAVGAVGGIPIGWFGFLLGALVVFGSLLPSLSLERTLRALLVLNAAAVVALFFYSTLVLRSLCLLCLAYGGFSLIAAGLYARFRDSEPGSAWVPAPMHLAVFAVIAAAGWWSVGQYHDAVRTAEQGAVNVRTVAHFYSLPLVAWPSEISPYRSISGTADFEGAPIRIVEYADPLCIDCRVLHEQLKQLEREFAGKINVAYQFFPLEAVCNDVVTKDKHPGACDLSYIAAYDPARFQAIHDEIQDNMEAARSPVWQAELARRHGLEGALADDALHARIRSLIRTGTEYEQTSDQYAHGIRSTPTLIINNRMIIGTLPTQQLRAIFAALVDEHEQRGSAFMENWLDPGCVIEPDQGPPKPCGTP